MYDGIGSRLAWLAVLLLLYGWFCFRVAVRVSQTGRRTLPWFFINFFLTAAPAAIMLWRHRRRQSLSHQTEQTETLRRCRHCGEYVVYDSDTNKPSSCPGCGMKLDEEYYA